MVKKDALEMASVSLFGSFGTYISGFSEHVDDVTKVFSLFFIVVPTGIWACCRAIQSVKRTFFKKD